MAYGLPGSLALAGASPDVGASRHRQEACVCLSGLMSPLGRGERSASAPQSRSSGGARSATEMPVAPAANNEILAGATK